MLAQDFFVEHFAGRSPDTACYIASLPWGAKCQI